MQAAYQAAKQASAASTRVADITEDRYQAGLASAVERYTAQQNSLDARRQEQQLTGRQWVNAVMLIKALGGNWKATDFAHK